MVLPMAVLAVLWWLGDLVSVNAVTQLAFTAMLVLTVPTVLGWQVTRQLLFPLAFLFFAVPIGEFMTPTLISLTADFTVSALRLTGIPVYREGMHFVIPSGNWSVIDECSGIRYLMASFMVGSLFAYLNYRSPVRRFAFAVISIIVPIVANWLRAYLIVMIAHLSDNKLATGVDHIVYGWVFFGIVIMALFFIGARWAEDPVDRPAAPDDWARAPTGSAPQRARQVVLVAMVALLATQLPQLLNRDPAPAGTAPRVELPPTLSPTWRAEPKDLSTWRPIFVGPSVELSRTYAGPEGRVGVYLAHYRDQSADRKLVSSVNVLVPMRGSAWNQLATGQVSAQHAGVTMRWQTADLLAVDAVPASQRQRLRIWRGYWIDGRLIGNDVVAKLAQAWQRLRGAHDDGAAVVLMAEVLPGEDGDQLLGRFVDANFDSIQRALAQAAAVR